MKPTKDRTPVPLMLADEIDARVRATAAKQGLSLSSTVRLCVNAGLPTVEALGEGKLTVSTDSPATHGA